MNKTLYAALQNLNLKEMDAVWLHEPWVRCVHPGWDILEGWEAVRESWQQMFDVTESMRITVRTQFIRVEGSTAWICCRESISSAAGGRSSSAQAQATNIFEKRSGEWYLVHHHASMLPPSRFRDPAGI